VNVFDPIDTDEVGNTRAYWSYQQVEIAHPVEYFYLTVDPGYNYLLRAVTLQWDSLVTTLAGTFGSPQLALEFQAMSSVFPRQVTPIQAALLTTPAGRSLVRAQTEPNGVIDFVPAGPQNFVRGSRKILNFAFVQNDTIQVKVTGQIIHAAGVWFPSHVDVLLEGYNVPEKSLNMWGDKQQVQAATEARKV
jgi:hypothetical protein